MVAIRFGVWGDRILDNRTGKCTDETLEDLAFSEVSALREFAPGNRVLGVMGWDGAFILDDRADPIDMAREYASIVQQESCGRCVPCRMGTRVAAEILTRIADGAGRPGDLDTLRRTARLVSSGSMCELGHTGLRPVIKLLDHFEDRFRQAIAEHTRVRRGHYHVKTTAPCVEACPEQLDIPQYIEHIRDGRYLDSLHVIQEKNPLAAVCGRVCVRFCEAVCRRGQIDEPIDIRHLKRFVSDVDMDVAVKREKPYPDVPSDAKRVAIVGAGPAGVTAAYHLLREGYRVEVFEAIEEPGGMAAVGIPDYRLPRHVLRAELDMVADMGAHVHYGQRLGEDLTLEGLRQASFDAVFVAIGAQLGMQLRIEGEDQEPVGYWPGIAFLRHVNLGEEMELGHKAIVVGGGNVAMDCSRSALRLGVEEVHLVYRRNREAMPADVQEIDEAEEEGVVYHFLCNPTRLLIEDGRVVGIECIRMKLGEPDDSGRQRPIPIEGSEFTIDCDMVIPAIGQRVDGASLDGSDVKLTRWSTLGADPDTFQTSVEYVFAGGDCVTGPASLIEAMAAGLRASHSIDQFLRTGHVSLSEEDRVGRIVHALSELDADDVDRAGRGGARVEMPVREVADRVADFGEVETGFDPEDALLEAERCLRCYRVVLIATES